MITQYKKLSEIEHVRARPGMYVGSTVMHTTTEYVYNESDNTMCKNDIEYNPAIIKLFSEILDNSIDEAKRNPQTLNTIKVDFTLNGEISIYDNGGIPVKMHDTEGVYIPELIFSNLRAGSNFNDGDDQALIGTHGLGSTLTNILSTKFIVETCDGKNYYKQEFTDGMTQKSDPKIKPSTNNHTKITFLPDYDYFKTSFTDGNRTKIIKRVVDAAANNTSIKFYLNGKRLNIKSFQDYITLFTDNFVYEENSDWKVGIGTGEDGFEQISFVNSVETYSGGTHVDYVVNQVLNKLREYFKKKYKYDVKPSDIKNHMQIFIACNINRPKFNSQTKELMISEVKDFKTTYEVSDKFIKQLLTTPLIDNIVDWLEAKRIMQEERDKEKENKTAAKANPKHVEKFTDASYKNRDDCSLMLCEGDCIEENQDVLVIRENGIFNLPIKDVLIGDEVITHLNNIKKVTNKTHKIKQCITIKTSVGDIKISAAHRLFVYNTQTKIYEFVRAGQLDKTIHKLCKNKLIDVDTIGIIKSIDNINDEKYNIMIVFNVGDNEYEYYFSATHKVAVLNYVNLQYEMIEAQYVNVDTHYILIKSV